jgi:hypothetical protein
VQRVAIDSLLKLIGASTFNNVIPLDPNLFTLGEQPERIIPIYAQEAAPA